MQLSLRIRINYQILTENRSIDKCLIIIMQSEVVYGY